MRLTDRKLRENINSWIHIAIRIDIPSIIWWWMIHKTQINEKTNVSNYIAYSTTDHQYNVCMQNNIEIKRQQEAQYKSLISSFM
jgi:hypothetical protein